MLKYLTVAEANGENLQPPTECEDMINDILCTDKFEYFVLIQDLKSCKGTGLTKKKLWSEVGHQ